MTDLDLESLEKAIKTKLEENTVVVFQVHQSEIEEFSKSLYSLESFFKLHKIGAIACPDHVKITVIPQGSGVKCE